MPTITNAGGVVLVLLGVATIGAMTLAQPAEGEDPRRTDQLAGPRALTVAVLMGATLAWFILVAVGTLFA